MSYYFRKDNDLRPCYNCSHGILYPPDIDKTGNRRIRCNIRRDKDNQEVEVSSEVYTCKDWEGIYG